MYCKVLLCVVYCCVVLVILVVVYYCVLCTAVYSCSCVLPCTVVYSCSCVLLCTSVYSTMDGMSEDDLCWLQLEDFRMLLIKNIEPSRITPYLRQCQVLLCNSSTGSSGPPPLAALCPVLIGSSCVR